MRPLIILTLLSTVISCSRTTENLSDNRTIQASFNNSEIADLEKILTFFEVQICETENISSDNVQECYKTFFTRMEKSDETGIVDIKISFERQLRLYDEIDSLLFNQLWTFNRSWRRNSPDTLKSLTFNDTGKYVRFLESFAADNKLIKDYYESFQAAGDISPDMVVRLINMHQAYDTRDIRVRLLIAIHYLTMNDQYERREKY